MLRGCDGEVTHSRAVIFRMAFVRMAGHSSAGLGDCGRSNGSPSPPGSLNGSMSSTVTLRQAPCHHREEREEKFTFHLRANQVIRKAGLVAQSEGLYRVLT